MRDHTETLHERCMLEVVVAGEEDDCFASDALRWRRKEVKHKSNNFAI